MGDPLVTFDLRMGRIFVGDIKELATFLNLGVATATNAGGSGAPAGQSAPGANSAASMAPNGQRSAVRDFARPFGHRKLYERMAILFHYAHRIEGRSALTSRELSDWFGLCGFKTPVRMDKTLDNLMRQRRMVERTGPGQWALTAAGENVALDLLEQVVANGGS